MRIFKTRTASPRATKILARAIARLIPPGAYVKLEGDLGSGKTTFAAGFAGGEAVSSPSFVLKKTYFPRVRAGHKKKRDAIKEIHHIDLWRLSEGADVFELFDGDGNGAVWLIEWAERLPRGFPDPSRTISVKMKHAPAIVGKNSRREVIIETASPRLAALLKPALKSKK
ncbi:MAG: tRNA (adenosine(37)-N6)-threonylcarbamoyltransferase complex ATPase subunit type 1 TsaE [Endomicrobiia bacterium]|nr:tRNA (adenosine(37)-N6)-threonylcarbamoyltransferase complex ATPase subunit type 1 TsaE [Endomicrobiia bacterium]